LVVPVGQRVRPTKDIVREALFSALDARGAIQEATVLDLYAGSGALAIESISRGAARATLVERDRDALAAIKANVQMLGYDDRVRVVAMEAARFVEAPPPADAPFDVVFVDPPYTTADSDVSALLAHLLASGWLEGDAIVSIERPARHPVAAPPGCTTQWQRAFGDTLLTLCWKSPTGPLEEETRLS
jgi:16S rRNA (guanine(966)-N(2))-methyltransferase RsmD